MPRRKQAWTGWGRPMQRVAGWDFDHRLNGYITTAADRFSCDCGEEFPTPSGYRKCGSCGRAWNSYVIGTDNHGREASLEKVIVREIPVRKDVIVASKRQGQEGKWPRYEYDSNGVLHVQKHPSATWQQYEGGEEGGSATTSPTSTGRHSKRRRTAEGDFGMAFDAPPKKRDKAELFGDETPSQREARRRRFVANDCDCWEGYERVPGTEPCAKGSCRKKAARRYVAWCRQVGRMPNTAGFRRFRTAERMVRIAKGDQYTSPGEQMFLSPGQHGMPSQWSGKFYKTSPEDWEESPDSGPSYRNQALDQRARRNQLGLPLYDRGQLHPRWQEMGYTPEKLDRLITDESTGQPYPHLQDATYNDLADYDHYGLLAAGTEGDMGYHNKNLWNKFQKRLPKGIWGGEGSYGGPTAKKYPGYDPITGHPLDKQVRRRRADRHKLRRIDLREQEEQPQEEEVSIEHFSSRRRRAELFDITEEGEMRKGKGRSDTPKMRKNPKDWSDRRQNGQFTKRWN